MTMCDSAELREAEMRLGMAVALGISPTLSDIDARALLDALDDVRAELARSRKVVQAATALAAKWEAMRRCYQSVEESDQLGDLLDALAAEVAALPGPPDTERGRTDG